MSGSKRARRLFTGNALVAFGGVSAVVQFVGQLFPHAFPDPGLATAASLGLCVGWGLLRARPPARLHQRFQQPDISIVIEGGDLFDRRAHLVVGFSDTFDTSTDRGGLVVSEQSLQGQLLARRYGGDVGRLDQELDAALHTVTPVAREERRHKQHGKLRRYPLGTVAVLGHRPELVFAVAYSRIGNDYVANSSVEELWYSLNRLWDAVYLNGRLECIAMPLIGSGLARLDRLDGESLLRLILLSFVLRSRERKVSRELRIVIRPEELERIDMLEVEAFLSTLGSRLRRP